MIKTTYSAILSFRAAAQQWIIDNKERTKFHYALEKMLKVTKKHSEEFSDLVAEANNNHASVDKDKNVMIVNDSYQFTPAKRIALQKRIREIEQTEVEVEEYISPFPPELSSIYFIPFEGFVVKATEENDLPEKATPKQ